MELIDILERIKAHLKLKSDKEIAKILNMSYSSLANHKLRNSIPYNYLHHFCTINNISMDWLFYGKSDFPEVPKRKEPNDESSYAPLEESETGDVLAFSDFKTLTDRNNSKTRKEVVVGESFRYLSAITLSGDEDAIVLAHGSLKNIAKIIEKKIRRKL